MERMSEEELAKIKSLPLQEYASIPIIYEEEIKKVFFEVLPRLISIVEDHATMKAEPVQPQMPGSVQELPNYNLILLKSLLTADDRMLQALEKHCAVMRNQYNRKVAALDDVPAGTNLLTETLSPPISIEAVSAPKVPWFKRIVERFK